MKFASPDPAAATPPDSCPPGAGHRGRASPFYASWEPFSPAVPPACHKQRSRAVCSGQSRSLQTTVALGSGSLTWGGGGGRNCMAGKGSGPVVEARVLDGTRQR